RLQGLAAHQRRRDGGPARRAQLRPDRGDRERALEEILRIGPKLVAATLRRRADDDLLPADATGVVRVGVVDACRAGDARAAEDDLEPRRLQSAGPLREGEHAAEREKGNALAVDR